MDQASLAEAALLGLTEMTALRVIRCPDLAVPEDWRCPFSVEGALVTCELGAVAGGEKSD